MKRYYKVWSVDFDNENKATVALSRSRKVQDTEYDKALEKAGGAKNGYITEFRDSYVNFFNKAVNQLKKYDIKEGDTIIADIEIKNEPYVKDGELCYMKGYKHCVYEFELPGSTNEEGKPAQSPKNIDKAPIVDEETVSTEDQAEDDDDLPF